MKTGIILPHLGNSQLTYEVQKIVFENQDTQEFYIFYEQSYPSQYSFFAPIMNISEMKHFSGRLIGFTLSSLSYLDKAVLPIEPIVYLYDLEWLRGKTDYISNVQQFRKYKLYTRSQEYAELIQNYTNHTCEFKQLKDVICQPSLLKN